MAVKIRTSEMSDTQKAEENVRDVQEQAREAEAMRKQRELLLREAQEAAEKKEIELQEAMSIEKEIGETTAG
ncbi:MAG TPA: hypothetical protein VLF89_06470 [Candidatus Saccharimonadales bacterium]|nr:hypothetical protein [Candidatus Saccharimonadales bacterium]